MITSKQSKAIEDISKSMISSMDFAEKRKAEFTRAYAAIGSINSALRKLMSKHALEVNSDGVCLQKFEAADPHFDIVHAAIVDALEQKLAYRIEAIIQRFGDADV